MPTPPDTIGADALSGGSDQPRGRRHPLRLRAADLTFIRIDHQTRLQFGLFEVVIETPFVLVVDEEERLLDPADRSNLGPLLALYPDSLASASIDEHAALSLMFASGASITVRQDPCYEAWQINGPDGYLVVCTPGTTGDLATWT
jgi:hypothetical protein